jgi:hypothetical protein
MSTSEVSYEWQPISDLPENWNDLRRDDLHLVQQQWAEEKGILKDPEKIQKLELQLNFRKQGVQIFADVLTSVSGTAEYWTYQIVETAKHHGYFADLGRFRDWVQLRLRLPGIAPQTSIVVSFHHRGSVRGLMVATAFVSTSVFDDAERDSVEARPLGQLDCQVVPSELFNYSASHSDPAGSFGRWLDGVVETALDMWQARI